MNLGTLFKFGVPWCVAMVVALNLIKGPAHREKHQSAPANPPIAERNPFAASVPENPMVTGPVFDGLPSGWGEILQHLRSRGMVTEDDPWRIIERDGKARNGGTTDPSAPEERTQESHQIPRGKNDAAL